MTFLTPLFALLAAAVAVPTLVILYFLKLRRQTVEVSTTLLWKKAIEDLQANAPFQKLRRNLLLFLQLLALAAALFALAQPQLSAAGLGGVRHVILIDRSASMQATDGDEKDPAKGEKTRLERAKEEARRVVDSMREASFLSAAAGGAGDEAMVIAFDATAEVRQNFTPSKAALRAAIEAIDAGDDSSSLKEAIKLAKAYSPRAVIEDKGLVASGPPARIHIISDGRLPDAGSSTDDPNKAALELTPEDEVLFHSIGSKDSSNLGIVGLRAERSFDKPGTMSVFVGVQSSFRAARTVDVELSVDGQVAGIRSLTLPAASARGAADRRPAPGRDERGMPVAPELSKPETEALPPVAAPAANDSAANLADVLVPATGGVVFSLDRAEGAVIVARLRSSEPDPLAVDDLGYLVVPPAKRLSVALITPGNLFVREALEGMNLAKLEVFAPAEGQALLDNAKKKAEFDVFVLDRWLPRIAPAPTPATPTTPARSAFPAGRFMVLGAVPPPPLGLIDGGLGEGTVIVDWKRDHPVLRGINLDALIINPGRLTEKKDGTPVSVIAQAQGGPAIIEASDDQTRLLAVSFDITASSWPFDPGFVLFMAAGLSSLASDGASTTEGLRPGATLAEGLPAGAQNATVGLPDNTRAEVLPTSDGRVVYGPLRKVGIYTLSWAGAAGSRDVLVDGRARRALAVNLLDPQESDIAAAEKISLPSRVVQAQAGAAAGTRRLWPFLLLLALGVMLVEWYIYNRKVMI
ncbi:MAG: vWA domain-containing protein [Phycisphaerales bacterium]